MNRLVFLAVALIFNFQMTSFLSAQCSNFNASDFGDRNLYKTTGDYALDQKFNSEQISLQAFFNVDVDLFMIDDAKSPTAWANCDHPGGSKHYDGIVAFGFNMLKYQLWGNKGEVAVAGVLAHEFAHVYQCVVNTPFNRSNHRRELQADFLAGYYLASKDYISAERMKEFARSLAEAGGDDYTSPKHHGTSEQRVSIMYEGYNSKHLTLYQAYKKSIEILNTAGYKKGGSPSLSADQRSSGQTARVYQPAPAPKIRKPRPEFHDRIFITGAASMPYRVFNLDSINVAGLSGGIITNNSIGGYASICFNRNATFSGDYYETNNDVRSDADYYYFNRTGQEKIAKWEATIGITRKLFRPVWLQMGGGASVNKTYWEVDRISNTTGNIFGTEWAKNTDQTWTKGVAEAGLILNLRWFVLNYVVKNVGLRNGAWSHRVGVGISFTA